MMKYAIVAILAIAGAVAWMYFGIGSSDIYREPALSAGAVHKFNDPSSPIQKIRIAAVYFVPKNKALGAAAEWRTMLERNLERLREFHALQFRGRSEVVYDIYPAPVVGENENLFYDTEVTQYGNPEGLRSVARELEARIFAAGGDLYRADFAPSSSGEYRVLYILYEGVGAAGSENVAFIARRFLSDPQYSGVAATLFAHEFYHTLGIPDGYETEHATPTSPDIMGLGREAPIDRAYIESATLRAMGL